MKEALGGLEDRANQRAERILLEEMATGGVEVVDPDVDPSRHNQTAAARYETATGVSLGDAPYELVGRLTGDPRLAVIDGKGALGLEVDVLGARIGDRLFVDATQVVDGESRFAGEI